MTATKKLRQHPKPPTRSALARPTGSASCPHFWYYGYDRGRKVRMCGVAGCLLKQVWEWNHNTGEWKNVTPNATVERQGGGSQ